jgi:hypothetical protein
MTRKQNPAPLGGGTGQIGGGACSTRPGKHEVCPGPEPSPPTGAHAIALAGAGVVADWLLRERPGRKFFIHVAAATAGAPATGLPWHYRYKSLIGVAYWHRDVDQARAWTIQALLSGAYVFRTRARERWTHGWGWSLDQGELSDFLLSE